MKTLGDVRISPGGERVLWVETRVDSDENCYRSRIMWSSFGGGDVRPLTEGTHRDTHPRWSPDGGWVAFLSDRPTGPAPEKRVNQIWVIPTDGGEPWRVTDLKHGVKEFSWSPDGRSMAVVAPVPPEGPQWEDEPDEWESDPYLKHNRETRVITRIRFRWDGIGYFDEKRLHLGVLDLEIASPGIARPSFLTSGEYDVASPTWSPDGRRLVFVSNLEPDNDYHRHLDLYEIDSEGGELAKLTRSLGPISSPVFSPDGSQIAFFGHAMPVGNYSSHRLWVLDRGSGELTNLTEDWDYTVGDCSLSDVRGAGPTDPAWTEDGEGILFPGSVRGRVHLFEMAPRPGPPQPLTSGDCVISGVSFCAQSRRAAFIRLDPLSPGRIHTAVLGPEPAESKAIHDPNASLLEGLELSKPERFTLTSDDLSLDGWIMKPPGFDPERKYPAVLQIHGGPMAMYGDCFFHEFQFLAARDLVVIYSNPRGSQGYGEDFCGSIRGEWGDKDYRDVMAAVNEALRRYPFIDETRLGVTGGSYGGFMTNWIVTHTDRFKAGVTQRSVVNRHSSFGTSDIGFMREDEMGGLPWEVPMNYLEISPIYHIANCRTPLMIIHSDMDLRCPIEGAEQLFVSLKKLGVETEFVRFSGESHGLSRSGRPWRRIFRLDKILEWMERYLKD